MSGSETHSEDKQEASKDDVVLPQIGEDPGLPAETLEQDSKKMDQKENKHQKGTDSTKIKE
jgi:hypothetical protein